MKNKGFSLVECIICIVILSGSIIGITTFLFCLNNDYKQREYESKLGINYYAIFKIFDSDPANAKENIVNCLGGTVLDDGSIEIKVMLKNTYKNVNEIIYKVYLEETDISYKLEVQVEGILKKYDGINEEKISKREIAK